MQFIITAYDGTDEGAVERRMAARPAHLENIGTVKETGSVVCAGGITGEDGKAIGSFLVLDFPSRAELDAYLEREPYIQQNVWQKITVESCNVVILQDERVGK